MNRFVAGHEIDAWWEAEQFGVELDVFETHGSRLSFEQDRLRDDELLLARIETTRVTGPRLEREPEAVVDSLRRHLATSLARAGIRLEPWPRRPRPEPRQQRSPRRSRASSRSSPPGRRRSPADAVGPWQRAALLEGVGAKQDIQDPQARGGARWQS